MITSLTYSGNTLGYSTTICPNIDKDDLFIGSLDCAACKYSSYQNYKHKIVECSFTKNDDKKEKNMYDIKEVIAFEFNGKIYNSMNNLKDILINKSLNDLLINYKDMNNIVDYMGKNDIIKFIKENIDKINSKMSDIALL